MSNSACAPCTRKNGNFSDQMSAGKSPGGRELVHWPNQTMTSGLWACAFVISILIWNHAQWKHEQIVLTAKKWTTPHVQCAMNWFFKLMHKFAQVCFKLLISIHFLHLSTTCCSQRRVATLRTSKKWLLGSRFNTFSCACGHHDPISGPKNDLRARKV